MDHSSRASTFQITYLNGNQQLTQVRDGEFTAHFPIVHTKRQILIFAVRFNNQKGISSSHMATNGNPREFMLTSLFLHFINCFQCSLPVCEEDFSRQSASSQSSASNTLATMYSLCQAALVAPNTFAGMFFAFENPLLCRDRQLGS